MRAEPGVVHFGPGAFHRAHQAAYFDALLGFQDGWSICEVALNSTVVAEALGPQDGLYTLALLSGEPEFRIIGSICEFLTPSNPTLLAKRLSSPRTRLITATVTEKGYCLTSNGHLDVDHPTVRHDLVSGSVPRTFIGWLASGLGERRRQGRGGLTVLSCDNLANNGQRLRQAVLDFVRETEADLASWIEDCVRFPNAMVDSITPATDDRLRSIVSDRLGVFDAWPIQREKFSQWVIEEEFASGRPPLDDVGVQFVQSVDAFENAKLRLLNGAHSSLAYLGLLLGYETVAEAMADTMLAAFIEQMMREEIAATLSPLQGQSISTYIDAILERFRNPAMRHLLSQIAWDGSQKLPFRLVGTIGDRRSAGAPSGRLAIPIAAWFRFLGRSDPGDAPLIDPLGKRLTPLARAGDLDGLLGQQAVFPRVLAQDAAFRAEVTAAYASLGDADHIKKALSNAL